MNLFLHKKLAGITLLWMVHVDTKKKKQAAEKQKHVFSFEVNSIHS